MQTSMALSSMMTEEIVRCATETRLPAETERVWLPRMYATELSTAQPESMNRRRPAVPSPHVHLENSSAVTGCASPRGLFAMERRIAPTSRMKRNAEGPMKAEDSPGAPAVIIFSIRAHRGAIHLLALPKYAPAVWTIAAL